MEPVIITVLLTVFVPIFGSFIAPFLKRLLKEKIHFYAIGIAVVTAILGIVSFILGSGYEEAIIWKFDWIMSLDNPIRGGIFLDRFSLIMLLLVSNIGMLIVIFSHDYMKGDESLPRYYFWILFFIGNMLGLLVADNLLMLFIFWEGVGLCSYGLIGFWNKDNDNVKSGNKAFLVTRAGDVGLLAAIILIYINAGTMNISELGNGALGAALGQGLIVLVGVLILIGIAGKSAQFPLQFWLPEAMAGPSTVSALIHAATMVKAGVYLGGRFLPFFIEAGDVFGGAYAGQVEILFTIIAIVGIFTAFFAASIGMAAKEFKKILAFSTISQLGYMIGAIGVAGLLLNDEAAFFSSVFHMTSHMFFKALLFLGAGAILHAVTTTKNIFEMGGLRKYMPKTTIVFAIGALSLSGIPPFSGFFSKDTIFEFLMELSHESTLGLVLLVVAILAAVMTFFYSMRMLGAVFFGESHEKVKEAEKHGHLHDPSWFMMGPLYVLALGATIWGFFGGLIEQWITYHHVSIEESSAWLGHLFGNPWTWIILAIILIVGGIPGYLFYFRRISTQKIADSFIGKFFFNRWYWNWLMMKIFVDGSMTVGDGMEYSEKGIDIATDALGKGTLTVSSAIVAADTKGVDGSVNGIAKGFQWIGDKLKKVETGFISQYIWIGIAGFVVLLLVITLLVVL